MLHRSQETGDGVSLRAITNVLLLFGNWHDKRKLRTENGDCQHFIPKKRVLIFFHSTMTEALVLSKEWNKTGRFFFPFFKMAHFTSQNGPFCRSEWFILSSRTGRFRVQNESFWKPGKCKENTSCFFSALYNILIFRAYASTRLLFWRTGLIFV